MKFRVLPAVLVLLFISACIGPFAAGIETPSNNPKQITPTGTATQSPHNPILTSDTQPEIKATLSPTNTPFLTCGYSHPGSQQHPSARKHKYPRSKPDNT